jgi:hypothetical protein
MQFSIFPASPWAFTPWVPSSAYVALTLYAPII